MGLRNGPPVSNLGENPSTMGLTMGDAKTAVNAMNAARRKRSFEFILEGDKCAVWGI